METYDIVDSLLAMLCKLSIMSEADCDTWYYGLTLQDMESMCSEEV